MMQKRLVFVIQMKAKRLRINSAICFISCGLCVATERPHGIGNATYATLPSSWAQY